MIYMPVTLYVSALKGGARVPVKAPPKGVIYSSYNLTKSGRTGDGTMTMELVAKKRKFQYKYDALSSKFLDPILSVIDDPENMFFTVEYPDEGVMESCVCYVGEIERTSFRQGSIWYWKDVSFDFIER